MAVLRSTSLPTLPFLFAFAVASAPAAAQEHAFETDALRVPVLKTGGSCVIRNVTIHSAVAPARLGDVLVVDGRIKAVGKVDAPEGIVAIDGTGEHLAPGVVDCHSHMATDGGLNEGTASIAAEVRARDVVNADDLAIYRALAGGVTTVRILHGSANAIGGQDAVIKLKRGRTADEILFPGAQTGIKFALGENPKRSRGGGGRFPATRMGVEAVYNRAFERAREYQREWAVYQEAVRAGATPVPPRRDLRLDALVGVLEGKVHVHCHCYRADEILMIIRASQRFGFRLATLQHVLEGYKVAAEMAAAGVGGSTFSDWWAYKIEAYDAIPQNAALMDRAGVLTSLNSDSGEMVRRLYGEAAKSVRYAGMERARALALVTLNPARQLGLGERVGSIEVGKDANLVLLNGDPLSSLARVEWTMVDGEIEFQRRDAFGLDAEPLVARELAPSTASPLEWKPEGGPVLALSGGTVHPVDGPDVENGTVLIQDGLILQVGAGIAVPASARVIDVTGKHVWPGMIAVDTSLGLREIGSIQATIDTAESGGDQPDLSVTASINAGSAHIGVTRSNGITRAQVAPQGGGPIMGQSSLIDLAGDTWEELLLLDRDMLHIRFPSVANDAEKKEEPEAVKKMRALLAEGREYARLLAEARTSGSTPPRFDPRLHALAPYVRGHKKVAVRADNAQSILFAIRFVQEEKLDAVLLGATEGWKVADAIARSGLPVAVGPVLGVPRSEFDPYDAQYADAAVLTRAGVEVALTPADGENARNLPFQAAMAVAFGLPHEEGVRAITLYAARLLGIDDRFGSLTPGKVADVVVTDGDLLEITSRTEYVLIDGEQVDRSNRQTRLLEKYEARLGRTIGR